MIHSTSRVKVFLLSAILFSGPAASGGAEPPATRGAEESSAAYFNAKVRPILETRCVRCHQEKRAKGGLSLATRAGLLKGGKGGAAIEPGAPAESVLIQMISGEHPEMPKGGKPLARDEIETLSKWIERGAPWPAGVALREPVADLKDWWAIRPLNKPPIPEVRNPDRVRTPIDAFVIRKLEEKGLALSADADRATLIRRLTYDLHGLPPTLAEIDAFVVDNDPNAYEKLVDRLLDSPRYGERWARHWLDVVHYADTHGYDKDKRRDHAWPYRDYVIKSFNEDKPYALFVREQLAGDAIDPGNADAVVATGFVAAGPWDFVGHVELAEGTVEKEKTRLLDRDDMVTTVMSTFVSLTAHCARCHDHKFDPIPQRDYYRLQAVFAGVDRGDRPYPNVSIAPRLAEIDRRRETIRRKRDRIDRAIADKGGADLAAKIAALRDDLKSIEPPPEKTRSIPRSPSNGYHSFIETKQDVLKWVEVDLGSAVAIDEIRLIPARPVDFPDAPGFGFPLRFKIDLSLESSFEPAATALDRSRADVPNPGDNPLIVKTVDKPRARYVRVTANRLWKRTDDYIFALGELQVWSNGTNVAARSKVRAFDSIEGGLWSARCLVDGCDSRRRIDAGEGAKLVEARSEASWKLDRALCAFEERIDPELRSKRDSLERELAELDGAAVAVPKAYQVYALVSHQARPIHLLKRGDVEQQLERLGAGALSCVPGLDAVFPAASAEAAARIALAEWIVDPKNVLTWRSIVNRIWGRHFGKGIVDTPNDFGKNGSAPTHPELLDRLAIDFRDGGGSFKKLDKMIVCSSVYRQVSTHDPRSALVDADDRLLWRQNRVRLDAESIRDATLAIAGRLDLTPGGPGYDLFRFKDDHSPIYDHDAAEKIDPADGRRRTIYRFAPRSVPNPFIECLDGADPNVNVPVRNTTITALQALTLLNDPFMLAQAEAFSERLKREEPNDSKRIDLAFRHALGRTATEHERVMFSAYIRDHGPANACRLLFNLNEFLFVD